MTSAHSHPHPTYSLPPPPLMQNEFKLPSLKDLNFQYRSPAPGPSQDTPPLATGAPHSPHTASSPSHTPYPPSQPAAPPFHQHPHPAPSPHDQVPHTSPYHGSYPFPSQYAQQRQPPPMPPHAHPHPHHQMTPVGYPQPPNHWHPHPLPQQHPYPGPPHFAPGFARTTALVPTNLDPRPAYPHNPEAEESNVRQNIISKIASNCKILYEFASRYAQLQSSLRHVQPRRDELAEMAQRAATVVRLLEDLKRIVLPETVTSTTEKTDLGSSVNGEDHRPPKRPWEEISKDGGPQPTQADTSTPRRPAKGDKSSSQSMAEKDMEIIRSKRASTTGTNLAGQPKSKYRKRSRASPPGKCHSCNIRETPEWRRGPDGARTLCNACGLHYAKLIRKRDKQPDGKPAPIDLQTLRASTAQARGFAFPDNSPPPQRETSPQSGYRQDEDADVKQDVSGAATAKTYSTVQQNTSLSSPSPLPPPLPLPSMMTSDSGLPPVPPPWVTRGSSNYGDHPSHGFRGNHSSR